MEDGISGWLQHRHETCCKKGGLVWFGGGFTAEMLFPDRWTYIWQYSPLRTEPSKSYWFYLKTLWWYLGQQYINRKESFFTLVSVLSCLLLPTPTFSKMMLKCSRSSTMRCNNSIRSSSSPSFDCKRQWKPIIQSMWLRKPGKKWRPKPRKRPRGKGLWRRRRRKREQWSTSSNSRTRC